MNIINKLGVVSVAAMALLAMPAAFAAVVDSSSGGIGPFVRPVPAASGSTPAPRKPVVHALDTEIPSPDPTRFEALPDCPRVPDCSKVFARDSNYDRNSTITAGGTITLNCPASCVVEQVYNAATRILERGPVCPSGYTQMATYKAGDEVESYVRDKYIGCPKTIGGVVPTDYCPIPSLSHYNTYVVDRGYHCQVYGTEASFRGGCNEGKRYNEGDMITAPDVWRPKSEAAIPARPGQNGPFDFWGAFNRNVWLSTYFMQGNAAAVVTDVDRKCTSSGLNCNGFGVECWVSHDTRYTYKYRLLGCKAEAGKSYTTGKSIPTKVVCSRPKTTWKKQE